MLKSKDHSKGYQFESFWKYLPPVHPSFGGLRLGPLALHPQGREHLGTFHHIQSKISTLYTYVKMPAA